MTSLTSISEQKNFSDQKTDQNLMNSDHHIEDAPRTQRFSKKRTIASLSPAPTMFDVPPKKKKDPKPANSLV